MRRMRKKIASKEMMVQPLKGGADGRFAGGTTDVSVGGGGTDFC